MEKILEKLGLLILTANLSLIFSTAWAACFPNGNITGANGQIILGVPGCADASGNTASVLVGASIVNGAGTALIGSGVAWTITNNGSISASGIGIDLENGGMITNQAGATVTSGTSNAIFSPGGQPQITLVNAGTIDATTGLSGGLLLGGATVINLAGGIIQGGFDGLSISANGPSSGGPSSVDNAGIIRGGSDGIELGLGGNVLNRSTGLIDGFIGIALDDNGTIDNFGQIGTEANTSTAIALGAGGGTVINEFGGVIIGPSRGVTSTSSNTIVHNFGTMTSTFGRDVLLSAGGTVINHSSGVMTAFSRTVFIDGGPGIVVNAGTMTGNLGNTGSFTIELRGANSSVINSGIINGDVGFFASNDTFLMTAGKITGILKMGSGGNETATFQGVNDSNIGSISVIDGGGGGGDKLIFNHSQHSGGSEMINWETITLNNGSTLVLSSNLILGGLSVDKTATLNINSSTLFAHNGLNTVIQANGAFPALVNNAGSINLASPNANNSLTIRGNYAGLGGNLTLNSVLNGDNSPADKLVIDGINGSSSATGNTFVTIHNLGGAGALTTTNGILVVQAINNATTAPNTFTLSAPIRAGAYDYRLFRGGLNPNDPATMQDWFLRSTFISPNVPSILLPIIGPELSVYGSVLPTAMAIGRATVGTLHERIGDEVNLLNDNSCDNQYMNGIWIRALGQHYKENYPGIANSSASANITGLQLGVDVYRALTANNHLNLAGFYAAYTRANPSIDGKITNPQSTAYINVNTGSINLDSATGGVYWTHFWERGAYVDLVAQASSYHGHAHSFRAFIPLNGTATAVSAELGYPIPIAQTWQIEPEIQLIYQRVKLDNTSDQFSAVSLGTSNGWVGRIGTRVKYTRQIDKYLLQPYLRANLWSILSGNNADTVYANTTTIRTSNNNSWAQIGGGITVNITKMVSVYLFLDELVDLSSHSFRSRGVDGGLGLRANW